MEASIVYLNRSSQFFPKSNWDNYAPAKWSIWSVPTELLQNYVKWKLRNRRGMSFYKPKNSLKCLRETV